MNVGHDWSHRTSRPQEVDHRDPRDDTSHLAASRGVEVFKIQNGGHHFYKKGRAAEKKDRFQTRYGISLGPTDGV